MASVFSDPLPLLGPDITPTGKHEAIDPSIIELEVKDGDEWDMPVFAFHELDYVPSGYGGILAPYIETGAATMRAAATLMRLDTPQAAGEPDRVICDLGCGDGQFLIGLLQHINNASSSTIPDAPRDSKDGRARPLATGIGIDYSTTLLATASLNTAAINSSSLSTSPTSPQATKLDITWLPYDFNLSTTRLLTTLIEKRVTHIFVYLVPKQLQIPAVRGLLEKLWESEVVVCCHKFLPSYLEVGRGNEIMGLRVYEKFERFGALET